MVDRSVLCLVVIVLLPGTWFQALPRNESKQAATTSTPPLQKRCNSISRKTGKGGAGKCPWSLGTCKAWASPRVGDRTLLACHCCCQVCSLWSLLRCRCCCCSHCCCCCCFCSEGRNACVCLKYKGDCPAETSMQQQVNKCRVISPCRRRPKEGYYCQLRLAYAVAWACSSKRLHSPSSA